MVRQRTAAQMARLGVQTEERLHAGVPEDAEMHFPVRDPGLNEEQRRGESLRLQSLALKQRWQATPGEPLRGSAQHARHSVSQRGRRRPGVCVSQLRTIGPIS